MKLEWMGEHRALVEEYIKACNRYARNYRTVYFEFEGIPLCSATVQVLEYILENEEEKLPMSRLAERLGVTRGAFSKITTQLCSQELVEKYHPEDSDKEYVLTLTEKGRRIYNAYSEAVAKQVFAPIFQELDQMCPQSRADLLRIFRVINTEEER